MADADSLAVRRELLERAYESYRKSPTALLTCMVDEESEERVAAYLREGQYLLDKGWLKGSVAPRSLTFKLTSDGRDYFEAGGFWNPKPEVHVLQDREAAKMRGEKAVGEAYNKISSAVMSAPRQSMMALHRALPEAVRYLSSQLTEIYSQIPDATHKVVRDEFVETIRQRISAFIQSSNATYGRGTDAAAVALLAVRVGSEAHAWIPQQFDLAVYDRVKKEGGSRPPPPAPARIKQQKFGILDSTNDHYESDFKAGVGVLGVSVIFFDLDKFKDLNSRFSEPVVDNAVLPQLQEVIRSLVDHRGFAYAEGGDEFIVVLPNTNTALAESFTKELLDRIRSLEFVIERESTCVTASAGIASSTAPDDWQECRVAAAKAKAAAKAAGRDQYVVSERRV